MNNETQESVRTTNINTPHEINNKPNTNKNNELQIPI